MIVAAAVLAAASSVAITLLLVSDDESDATVTMTSSPPRPAAKPAGNQGEGWHQNYRTESWASHVKQVDSVGPLLFVTTDLGAGGVDTAMAICRAGKEHVARLGVASAAVTVYGQPDGLQLARGPAGGACAPMI